MRAFLFKHSANAITFAGIILAIWTSVMVWDYQNLFWVLVVALLVALTDLADGRLARKWGIVSQEGVFWDRVRDKLFMLPMLAFFLVDVWPEAGVIFAFLKGMIILILLTEVSLAVSMVVGLVKRFNISAHRAGKIKQVIYFVIVGLWLLMRLLEQESVLKPDLAVFLVLCALSLAAAVYALKSLDGYLKRFRSAGC